MGRRGTFKTDGPTKDGLHRFRIVVTDKPEDAEVLAWVTAQQDLNFSVGQAIRMFIKAYGVVDYKVSVMELAASILANRGIAGLAEAADASAIQAQAAVPKPAVMPPMTTGTDFGQAATLRPPVAKPKPANRASGQFLE